VVLILNQSSWTITVQTDQPYDVLVGRDLTPLVPSVVQDSRRVAIVHQQTCMDVVSGLDRRLRDEGHDVLRLPIPDAEAAKTTQVLAYCWASLGRGGFTRSDSIIGVGGGAATDLAGFVAATWLRGVRYVSVPTTLLGMVDAALGGKTGINTAEGKNLVGAFYEPAGVFCDLNALRTLGEDELLPGMAEVIKCGFISDPQILDLVERDPVVAVDADGAVLPDLVRRSVQVKADVVADDLTEQTSTEDQVGREVLNYGHTLGHAIERREHYRWRHGNAVSVGLVFAAELGRRSGRLSDEVADRHHRVLSAVGLPTAYQAGAFEDLLAGMALDKKTRGTTLRFVILEDVAKPTILSGPDRELLRSSYAAVTSE
jgi:3-dehydroquinate synthase